MVAKKAKQSMNRTSGLSRKEKTLLPIIFVSLFAFIGAWFIFTSQANPVIKPQIAGTIDRQGMSPSTYHSVVDSYVFKVDWAELQPNSGSELVTSRLDTEIQKAKTNNMHLKIRMYTGSGSPNWVKNLPVTSGTQGPVRICDPNAVPVLCGDIPHFWEKNVQDAYAAVVAKLAAKYDGIDGDGAVIQEVVIGGCATIFQEPLIRQRGTENIAAFQQGGYTEGGNWACEQAQIQAHETWIHTRSSLAFNPYDEWTGSGFKITPAKTEQLIDYCRIVLGERCVLGNNSIGKTSTMNIDRPCSEINGTGWASLAPYVRLYTYMKCKGAPVYFQTEFADRILEHGFTLPQVVNYAISLGAGMVELPAGYANSSKTNIHITPTDMVTFDTQLNNNALQTTEDEPTPIEPLAKLPGDTTPPSTPTGVNVTASVRRNVTLSWLPSTDNVGVKGYNIYRNNSSEPIQFVTNTSFVDSATAPNKTYSYRITAVDARANESALSSQVTVVTTK
jgi:hypothetical protein